MIIQANEKQAAEKEKSTEQKVQEQQSKDSEKVTRLPSTKNITNQQKR